MGNGHKDATFQDCTNFPMLMIMSLCKIFGSHSSKRAAIKKQLTPRILDRIALQRYDVKVKITTSLACSEMSQLRAKNLVNTAKKAKPSMKEVEWTAAV